MIKFITRKDGLIKNVFNRPNKNTEGINTECDEFKAFENKTGVYALKPKSDTFYALRDKRTNLIVDLKKHEEPSYESIQSTDQEFVDYVTQTGTYAGANSSAWWKKGFNEWFIKAYMQKHYDGNSDLMDEIYSAMVPN